jgi:hypothetical protein
VTSRFAYAWLLVLTIVLCFLLLSTRTVKAAGQHEYKVVLTAGDGDTLQTLLNQSSKDGWEYVGMTQPEARQHYLILRKGD